MHSTMYKTCCGRTVKLQICNFTLCDDQYIIFDGRLFTVNILKDCGVKWLACCKNLPVAFVF